MTKSLLIYAAFIAALSGCANASHTFTPDGKDAYNINCSGGARNWGACYEKAGDLCGRAGYDILTQVGEGGTVIGGSSSGFFGGSTHARTLVVSCKS